jgi:glycosyltransferase involved in cell wall biosynthesis
MACGTPVVAYPRGSVAEVMRDGVSGFVVENVDQAVAALGRIPTFSRRDCRSYFEQRFSAARMARDYLGIYRRILTSRQPSALSRPLSIDGVFRSGVAVKADGS